MKTERMIIKTNGKYLHTNGHIGRRAKAWLGDQEGASRFDTMNAAVLAIKRHNLGEYEIEKIEVEAMNM